MANYFTSLGVSSVTDNPTSHTATVLGTYTTNTGTGAPNFPYDLFVEKINPDGSINSIDNQVTVNQLGDGHFSLSYNSTQFDLPQGYSLEIATTDTANGSTISSAPLTTSTTLDGFDSGSATSTNAGSDSSASSGGSTPTQAASGPTTQNQTTQSSSSAGAIVTGTSTNNSPAPDDAALQGFLASADQTFGTASVSTLNGASGSTVSFDGQVGVVSPGANLHVDASQSADLFASGGSTLDLSGTPILDANGHHIGLSVQLGGGNNTVTLNHGPSSVLSSTGNDTLLSSGGHDTLSSAFGEDSLRGGGQSLLNGGSVGGDTLHGGLYANSHDTLNAGIGGDLLITNAGKNVIYGAGNDTIFAGNAQDTILAGYGAETIHGGLNASIFGGGMSLMDHGNNNVYSATGADTIQGSAHSNIVNIQSDASAVTVDGRTGTGQLTVNVANGGHGNDTLFGGSNTAGGSNLDVHVSQAFTVQKDLDQNGLHVVQLQGGQTLHVTNVTIDFNGTKTNV